MKKKKIMSTATMKDVARLAGVSTATVSRALMHPQKVATYTLQKVDRAAQSLGYCTQTLRRNVRRGTSSRSILVIVPDLCLPAFHEMIRGIQEAALKQGYHVLLVECLQPRLMGKKILQLFTSRQFDGAILLNAELTLHIDTAQVKSLLPIVMVNEFVPELNIATVHIDHLTAAFNAVHYLHQLGHQRIACICAPESMPLGQYRRQGYIQALLRCDIPLQQEYLTYGNLTVDSGIDCMKVLMNLPRPPSAVFCHDDNMAIGALWQAKQMGISVPDALSLIGFNDILCTRYCEPALTTIAIPGHQIGIQSVRQLLKQIRGESLPSNSLLLETNLLIRGSTAPPPLVKKLLGR